MRAVTDASGRGSVLDSAARLRERDAECRVRHACPSPFASLSTPRATLTFYQGDCLAIVPRSTRGSVDAIVTSPPYNLGVRYRTYEDTLPRERLPRVDAALGADGGSRAESRRLALPQRRRQADRPLGGDGRGAGRARRISRCRTRSTGSSRSPSIGRRWAGRRDCERDLAVGHYKPINSRAS